MKNISRHVEKKAVIAGILIISMIANIYMAIKINNYRYNIGKQSYADIEDIRQRNESNMDILDKSIQKGSIKNEEILKLYKNYDIISTEITELWQQYNTYTQGISSIFSKTINMDKGIENDINEKIKEYVSSTLMKEMENEKSSLLLQNDDLECFESMYSMSEEMYNYFNDFNKSTLNNLEGEEKEKKMVKKRYWIDVLQGIYSISNDYIDVQWNKEL